VPRPAHALLLLGLRPRRRRETGRRRRGRQRRQRGGHAEQPILPATQPAGRASQRAAQPRAVRIRQAAGKLEGLGAPLRGRLRARRRGAVALRLAAPHSGKLGGRAAQHSWWLGRLCRGLCRGRGAAKRARRVSDSPRRRRRERRLQRSWGRHRSGRHRGWRRVGDGRGRRRRRRRRRRRCRSRWLLP